MRCWPLGTAVHTAQAPQALSSQAIAGAVRRRVARLAGLSRCELRGCSAAGCRLPAPPGCPALRCSASQCFVLHAAPCIPYLELRCFFRDCDCALSTLGALGTTRAGARARRRAAGRASASCARQGQGSSLLELLRMLKRGCCTVAASQCRRTCASSPARRPAALGPCGRGLRHVTPDPSPQPGAGETA